MKKIKELLKNEKFKNILLSILLIFTLIYAFCCGFFIGTQKESIEELEKYKLTEIDKQERQPTKKSLVSVENNPYFFYLYNDYANDAFIYADIYYSYLIDESNGQILGTVFTANNRFELEDTQNSTTFTCTFDLSSYNIFITNHIQYIEYDYQFQRYQTTRYFIPQVDIYLSVRINGSEEAFAESFYGTSDNGAYTWSNDYVISTTGVYETAVIADSTLSLFYILGDVFGETYYDNGYVDGLAVGFTNGENAQRELYEQNDTALNKIWTILEKGIETALNVLSIEILPGIPLTICIIVPLIFGIIFFIWKGGAQ